MRTNEDFTSQLLTQLSGEVERALNSNFQQKTHQLEFASSYLQEQLQKVVSENWATLVERELAQKRQPKKSTFLNRDELRTIRESIKEIIFQQVSQFRQTNCQVDHFSREQLQNQAQLIVQQKLTRLQSSQIDRGRIDAELQQQVEI